MRGAGGKGLTCARIFAGAVWLFATSAHAAEPIANVRAADVASETQAPAIGKVNNRDLKQKRNYPMQPPLIPHAIRGYEINLNVNKCMACHGRARAEESQAPMVSVTHFMNRDGQFLAEISPRRFFCTQCHVTQAEVAPPVQNHFVDMQQAGARE